MKSLIIGVFLLITNHAFSCENTKRMIEHSLDDLYEQEAMALKNCPEEKEMISFIRGNINAYEFIKFYIDIKEN